MQHFNKKTKNFKCIKGKEKMSSKWAKELGTKCDLAPETLKFILEELSESCYGDATSSKKIIEELTLKCKFKKDELSKFISEVSRNCPLDAKKLRREISEAEGKKELVFRAIYKAAGRIK